MQKITLITVGKIKESFYRDAINEYSKRLSKYCKLTIIELEDEKTKENPSEDEKNKVLEKEGNRILASLKDDMYICTLEIEGHQPDSIGFSKMITKLAVEGESHICFIIGGSLGLHDSIKKKSDKKISFSNMTFPHQLMRVIFLEQLYRAYRIANNEPYHK